MYRNIIDISGLGKTVKGRDVRIAGQNKSGISQPGSRATNQRISSCMSGSEASGFQENVLLQYLENIRLTDPDGTVATDPAVIADDGEEPPILHGVFIAPSCSKGMIHHCKPVIAVDATFPKSRLRKLWYQAVVMTPAHKIFPLAFALGNNESTHSWTWFLSNLKSHVGEDFDWAR